MMMKKIQRHTAKTTLLHAMAFLLIGNCAFAQFAPFKTSGLAMQIYTMSTNGNTSVHNLTVSIGTNGVISGSGMRYDIAAAAFNAAPVSGTMVRLTTSSKLGLPVVAQTNREIYYDASAKKNLTNTYYSTNAPANILLTDNTRFKGVVTKSKEVYQTWISNKIVTKTNSQIDTTLTGVATKSGWFGQGTASQ